MTDIDADVLAEAIAERLRGTADRPLLSPKTLAERLGVSDRTARDMLTRGVIPSFKVEGSRRVDPVEVDRYLAEQQRAEDDARP